MQVCITFKVAYARKDLKADVVVDMATLTGAQGIATGKWENSHPIPSICLHF